MLGKSLVAYLPLLAGAVASVAAAPSFPQFPFPGRSGDGDHRPAPPHGGPGEVIDLSKHTIWEILNYTLHHPGHHDHGHDHDHEHQGGGGPDGGERPRGPPLHKLAYVVNRTESIKEYLNDPNVAITLFAPDDEALTPPRGHGPPSHHRPGGGDDDGHHHHHRFDFSAETDDEEASAPLDHPFYAMDGPDHHEPTDEEKRRFVKMLVTAILHYHIAPAEIAYSDLVDKQTIATSLNQTRDADIPFRIRSSPKFQLLPPAYNVKLNFYAGIREAPAIKAKNGLIYLLSAPLLPPLTALDQLLAFPVPFSTLTSAVQETELDVALAPWLHHHLEHKKPDGDDKSAASSFVAENLGDEASIAFEVLKELVTEAVSSDEGPNLPNRPELKDLPFTIFAPTNLAFAKIPFGIRTFLFSPFGRGYLKKLLSYHVVPQYIFHTDYQLNATRGDGKDAALVSTERVTFPAHLEPVEHATSLGSVSTSFLPHAASDEAEVERYVLPTVLGDAKNQSLYINVYSYRKALGKGPLTKTISVGNSEQDEKEYTQVWIADGVAWGGAVHAVNSIIRPVMPKHDHYHDHDHKPEGESDRGLFKGRGKGRKAEVEPKRKHVGHHRHAQETRDGQLEYFQTLWA